MSVNNYKKRSLYPRLNLYNLNCNVLFVFSFESKFMTKLMWLNPIINFILLHITRLCFYSHQNSCRKFVQNASVKAFTIFAISFHACSIAATATLDNNEAISPSHEDIFTRYGISKDIAKLGVSSLTQSENVVEHVHRQIAYDGTIHQSEVFLVQSTDDEKNLDIRIKYNPKKLDANEDIIEHIEQLTKNEYLLRQYSNSYDEKSVRVIEKTNGEVIVHFNYSKYGLPQNIAYFRFFKVMLTIVDKKISQMIITNSRPFTLDGYLIDNYSQKITFTTLKNGQVVANNKHIVAVGQKHNKPAKLTTQIKLVSLYSSQDDAVVLEPELLAEVSDPRIREGRVKLNRTFPLMADIVRRQGIDVPLPFGVSMTYRKQNMDLGFTSFNVMGINLDEFFTPEQSIGTIEAESLSLRADLNIFPFWNVYAIAGQIKVNAIIDAAYTGNIRDVFIDKLGSEFKADLACGIAENAGLPVCSPAQVAVPLKLEYKMLGGGTTLSVGYKEFFASLNATYTVTKLDGQNWGNGIFLAQPIIGYQLVDYRAQFFVGGEYQGLGSNMSGNLGRIGELNRDFTYNVGISLKEWAYLVGVNKQFGKHYSASLLFNKGPSRNSITANFSYRF